MSMPGNLAAPRAKQAMAFCFQEITALARVELGQLELLNES